MQSQYEPLLRAKLSENSYRKLTALDNPRLFDFLGEWVELCEPESVYVCDDSDTDAEYVRGKCLELGEEAPLAKKGQTIHYDSYRDQARDKTNTRYLVDKERIAQMGHVNSLERNQGLEEVRGIAKGIMKGKPAVFKLFCEGPTLSPFSIACAQLTDSWYVSHSEDILYRRGYEHFIKMPDKTDFFRFCHSAGVLGPDNCTVHLDKRRIYMDMEDNIVISMNDQYGGNSIGLKKHAMRLAIQKSGHEGWLCEHMFIMSVRNQTQNRHTYFCGAFPSACGKTATAMIPGEQIVGDDIAYFKKIEGEVRAVNVERGIFGIIKDVNANDDPVIWRTLQSENEMIFSNVLTGPDNEPYWLGMEVDTPKEGKNHSGEGWREGKKDDTDNAIPLAHGNARYTIRMDYLENVDTTYNDKNGVPVRAIVYGGRDSDTSVPIEESFDWVDGMIIKACTLESETTSATLGQEGVRVPQPMANLDFISYPTGQYIGNNVTFVDGIENVPRIYAVNYFLKTSNGEFCTSKLAKKVWLHWAEQRVHDEVEAHKTPTGLIPRYEDLVPLFSELLGVTYEKADYEYQFSFRCDQWLAKLERAIDYYKAKAPDCPDYCFERWEEAKTIIQATKDKYGAVVAPGTFEG